MPRNLRLTLPQNLHQVADTHFLAVHQIQEPEPGAIGERGKQEGQVIVLRRVTHISIICALTYMSSGEYICFSVCEETQSWNRIQVFRTR